MAIGALLHTDITAQDLVEAQEQEIINRSTVSAAVDVAAGNSGTVVDTPEFIVGDVHAAGVGDHGYNRPPQAGVGAGTDR